jgi:hypothetical protein
MDCPSLHHRHAPRKRGIQYSPRLNLKFGGYWIIRLRLSRMMTLAGEAADQTEQHVLYRATDCS